MRQRLLFFAVLALLAATGNAQSIFDRVKNKVKGTVENTVDQTIDKATDKAIGKTQSGKSADNGDAQEATSSTAAQPADKAAETTYAKSDFVPGDVVFFADDLQGEQLGEFPSHWDLNNGNAEVVRHDGRMALHLENDDAVVCPLIKGNTQGYLPDQFTFEFDYWCNGDEDYNACIHVRFTDANGNYLGETAIATEDHVWWDLTKPNDEQISGSSNALAGIEHKNAWNHFALSFNKRAMKIYINGTRMGNLPNIKAPASLTIGGEGWDDHRYFLTDFRLAEGAVPLYDRVMSDGKIVTYAITFDVGKATIKPESMTEIARIQKLMQDNPSLCFEVQGHCDNTGSAAVNDRLSLERAEAIVVKLVSLGIDRSRLSSVGKGSREPIADNSTAEGRAKNRRVVFVKK